MRIPQAARQDGAKPMSVRVNFGLRRACPLDENGAVLVPRLGLAYERKSHAELATEIEASFRDPFAVGSRDV
jgi:hypothetical protein